MSNIFITSDTHFCHDKPFIYKVRGYDSVEEMNEAIIEHWNKKVKPDDIVYHLGDVMLNDTAKGIQCLRRLNGKIYILTGNHDTATKIQQYVNISPNILHLGYVTMIHYNKCSFYLSHYPTLTSNLDIEKPLNRRVINLCGHSHTMDKFSDWDKGLIYHCEQDAHFCEPVNMEEIYNDIVKKLEEEKR